MTSYHGSTHSEPAKMEQIITEFFPKSLHIILESRCPYVSSRNYSSSEQGAPVASPASSTSSSSSFRPRDKWFNLALRDCPAALENIDFWRQSNLEPMVIDVILVQRPSAWDPLNSSSKRELVRNLSSKEMDYWNSDLEEFERDGKSETIIERWVIQYESRKSNNTHVSGNKRSNCLSSQSLYKKSTLLLRSLYATLRLLPAYKLFRELISSAQIRTYNLYHRVSSFVEPFTRKEEAELQHFAFAPVDTSCGRLCLTVLYRSSPSDMSLEPSTPMSPQFIPYYVGSPMAEPVRRFSYVPVSNCSSSSSQLGRRHSWSYDLYRASSPSGFPSPSPTYSESHASITKSRSHCLPPTTLPRHLPDETTHVYRKHTNVDEYWPSPSFSPSPTPSPPAYIRGSHPVIPLLRSESAPVNIPAAKLPSISLHTNNQDLPPSPPTKAIRPAVPKVDMHSSLFHASSTINKLFPSMQSEPAKLFGEKLSSNSPPQKSFSISSSRLSFQDEYDDYEFSGPFVVDDDDDMTDPGSRPGSFDQRGHQYPSHELRELSPVKKSRNTVVALHCLLKRAPPLHKDLTTTSAVPCSRPHTLMNCMLDDDKISGKPNAEQSAPSNPTSAGLISLKTTADAMEELRIYKDIKDELLKKSNNQR